MSKIKCIIIEDEPLAVKILSDYIVQIPFLELKATFREAISAIEFLQVNNIDLIFLDIHLPRLKGISFLKTLTNPPAVIITTAYHQYAVDGFNLNVVDYLLKPIEFERFLTAINKVKKIRYSEELNKSDTDRKEHIFISVQKKKVKLLFSEIIYIESEREYVKIVTTVKAFHTKLSTNEIESLLPSDRFRRIHRSYIIALDKMETYSSESVEVGGITLPIGRNYHDALKDILFNNKQK